MNNNEYKEIKLPEEMSKEEKINLVLDSTKARNEGQKVHGLMYNIVGFIGFLFFTIILGVIGFAAIFKKESVEGASNGAIIMLLIFTIIFVCVTIKFGINIIKVLKNMNEDKKVVISLQNVGIFFIALAFLTIMSMFIMMFINPESKFLNDNSMLFPKIAIGFGIVGTIIIYIDKGMRFFNKGTKIFEINNKKNIDK